MEASNSPRSRRMIQADANNISKESLDCGINQLNWCNGLMCQKLATTTNFIVALSFVGLIQGSVETYFRISSKQAAVYLNFDPIILDWLLVSSGLIEAIFALLITFYSSKYHPMNWLAGLIFLQSGISLITILPTLDSFWTDVDNRPNIIQTELCTNQLHNELIEEPIHSTATLILLFILQFSIGLVGIVFYTIGIIYIDNNVKSTNSPALIGTVFCAYIIGIQFGTGLSIIMTINQLNWWSGWVIFIPLLFIGGFLIVLFPRKLIKTVMRQATQKILNRTSRISLIQQQQQQQYFQNDNYIYDYRFVAILKRLFTNRILMFNLIGLMFIETATINFNLHEENYLQSHFYLPTNESNGLMDEWTTRFLSYLLRPPVIAVCLLVSSLIITKINPTGRSLALWNLIISIIAVGAFISFIYIDCGSVKIAGAYRGKIEQPFCAKECICDQDVLFSPICPADGKKTYFSPCHAGCTTQTIFNDFALYQNCTCGSDIEVPIVNGIATAGACNKTECQMKWTIFQILTVLLAALLGSTKINRIIITLRCVLPQDKSLALALELFLVGFAAYIPGKLGFDYIADTNCQYWSSNRKICFLQESPNYGNLLNIVCAILIGIGVICDIFVIIFAKNLKCFHEFDNDALKLFIPLQNMSSANNEYDEIEETEDESDYQRYNNSGAGQIPRLIKESPRFIGRARRNEVNLNNDTAEINSNTTDTIPNNNNNNNQVIYAEVVRPRKIESDEELNFGMQNSPTIPDDSRHPIHDEQNTFLENKQLLLNEQQPKPSSPETAF